MYTFTVIDDNGLSDTENIVVNFIDNEAPAVSFGYDSGNTATNWAQGKTITITAHDNVSSVIDSDGSITSYGGSGLASVKWKRSTDVSYTTISSGASLSLNQNGAYNVKAVDAVGNISEYTLNISGIDTAAPVVGVETPAGWKSTAYNASINYLDNYSGIASAKYAVTGSTAEVPAELSDLPESGGSVTVSDNGSSYIYYEVADNAGNTTSGWSNEVKVDVIAPMLTISADKGTAEGEAYISGEWTKDSVVFTMGNTATQVSGTTYYVSIGGRAWEAITGNKFTLSEDTNTDYQFKAVSGSEKESSVIAYTVRMDKTQPSINVSGNPTSWQNTDAVLDLTISDPGISGQTVTVSKDGGEPTVISERTFTAATNGSYTFTVTTGAGKTDSRTVDVAFIDKLAPDAPIITDAPAGWRDSDITLTVSAYDIEADSDYGKSEVASFVYSEDGGMSWCAPLEWDISGLNRFTVDATGDYTDRIMVKVTDAAGSTSAESMEYTVKIDKLTPELTVSANKGTAGGETYTSGEWTKDDVVFTLGNAATQLSGTTYQISIGGGEYENIAGSTYTVSVDTSTIYSFKAVSGSGMESSAVEYTVNRNNIRPNIIALTPAKGATDQSITPTISFESDKKLAKGDGYLIVYNALTNAKVMDIHSSNNRVRLSDKSVYITLPNMLGKVMEYYIQADEGFVTDLAGNKAEAFGGKDTWNFKTIADPVIPDNEIVILGYTVALISKADANKPETSQILTAVTDRENAKQHNIIAKASYSENGADHYVKLKVIPTMNADPKVISVSAAGGTATLSNDNKSIDVLIPQDVKEATVTISLGNAGDNKFGIKIINSSYKALVETSGSIVAEASESNLLNSVDLSEEIEASKLPDTTVDVTVKMIIEQKDATEIAEARKIEQATPGAFLRFLDISLEKEVKTTVEGGSTTIEKETITVTQQPVVIIIDLQQEMQGRYAYKIVREHNGVVEVLPAVTIDNGTRLRFETDRFSTYSIAYTPMQSSSQRRQGTSAKSADRSPESISSIKADVSHMTVDINKLDTELLWT